MFNESGIEKNILESQTPPQVEEEDFPVVNPDYNYLDGVKSTTELYRRVFLEHFKNLVPVVHFTNELAGGDLKSLRDTGFIRKFIEEGSRGKLHVGAVRRQDAIGNFQDVDPQIDDLRTVLQSIRDIAAQFMHHGRRTNKNQLKDLRGSEFSRPAAIIFEADGDLKRGTDNYYHWILKNDHGPSQIIELINFEAGRASQYYEPNAEAQQDFVKKFLHALGKYRLRQLSAEYATISDPADRERFKKYADGLVRARLIDADELAAALNDSYSKNSRVN